MAINLQDIPNAVKAYLDSKVTVDVQILKHGDVITPGEEINYRLIVKNADIANGGVPLTNVRYRLDLVNPAGAERAKLRVPADTGPHAGKTTNPNTGGVLTPNNLVTAMIYNPIDPNYPADKLNPGEQVELIFSGRAEPGVAGGNVTFRARVLGDFDLNQLFPKDEETPVKSTTFQVVS